MWQAQVSKIENIEEIWRKLIEVYGTTQLLLQNKMHSLGRISNLEKMKDAMRKLPSVSPIFSMVMSDLSNLAENYDLEGELYHGGGLQRILELIGTNWERKFIKFIANGGLKNKQKWFKLVDLLRTERSESERHLF